MARITPKLVLIILFFITGVLSAQTKIDPAEYKIERENLLSRKGNLLIEKKDLLSEIDSLTQYLSVLESKLQPALEKYFVRKYGRKNGVKVANGMIWKGMTNSMLKDSWGEPDKINKDVFSYGVFIQYTYGKITYFFRDGILTDWEEFK